MCEIFLDGQSYTWDESQFYCTKTSMTPTTSDAFRLIQILRATGGCDLVAIAKYERAFLGNKSISSVILPGTRHAMDWVQKEGAKKRGIGTRELRQVLNRMPEQCAWCGGVILSGKQNLCCDECVEEFLSRCCPEEIRRNVWSRDRGICAACGADTEGLQTRLKNSPNDSSFREELFRRGFDLEASLWEMDDIKSVASGGGLCDETNYQTLCVPCHKYKTAREARSA